ncbi:hypothetical protein RISK_005862 [Rhodopirellula islandica]|uniref:Uncharacterized protein n=1 Tax=Rhodopirellula islandica TaxID=595434 RepID=A0A0J1B6E1_RHOIS|nr:hypothetical protein RISK_005862 [Rhodopirellula islandica]
MLNTGPANLACGAFVPAAETLRTRSNALRSVLTVERRRE